MQWNKAAPAGTCLVQTPAQEEPGRAAGWTTWWPGSEWREGGDGRAISRQLYTHAGPSPPAVEISTYVFSSAGTLPPALHPVSFFHVHVLIVCAWINHAPPHQAPAALLVLGLPVQGAWLPPIRVWSSSSPVKPEDEQRWADGFCPQTWASDWCGTSHHRRLLWASLCLTWVQSQPPGATNHVCQGFLVKLSISVVKGEKKEKKWYSRP